MDLETRMSRRSFAGLAGKMMLAGAALLASGTSFAKDAEPETKNEPDLYAFLFSRSLDQRDLATEGILRKVMKEKTETAAKNAAIEEITILEKLAREHELEIRSSWHSAHSLVASIQRITPGPASSTQPCGGMRLMLPSITPCASCSKPWS